MIDFTAESERLIFDEVWVDSVILFITVKLVIKHYRNKANLNMFSTILSSSSHYYGWTINDQIWLEFEDSFPQMKWKHFHKL